ncbi:amino-acid n-acetyltransferase [Plasmopara halstedii]|uniref:amino-acid N-acetyltransferase n=1 Tax=Plasmopara halstedii TaxID=4781 RepID=A0A0P1A8C6_PLAHL|nr:amino-acid n-acetyltransferase [Plasmopara halstedii]CEG36950.1 amino-acid n-acetyltransferase [Plasmopara halstedii]|eukprot:XP_024573319.1 amino-acid n-acetyltransferase [Plasmopara halstedii]
MSARATLQVAAGPTTPVSDALGAGSSFTHAGYSHSLWPVGLTPSSNEQQATCSDFLPMVPSECLHVRQTSQSEGRSATVGPSSFTTMFRDMSPYINVHRGTTMVIHLPGQLVESNLFGAVMHDIALLNTFGVKIVLVAGSRPQLNRQLSLRKLSQRFDCGMRITGPMELQCAMDAAGSVRFQIESYLGRGIVNSPGRARTINISSGNFITAQPVGVRGGVDFKNTGEMRRLNVDKVRTALDDGDIVLISSIGYSASGEVFNCLSEQVASKCAIQLESAKLIFMHNGEELIDSRSNSVVQTLVIDQAQQYVELAQQNPEVSGDYLLYLKESIKACINGVKRSHLVSRHVDGGLLQELFTRDGGGLMITKHMYEGIRTATTNDIVSIMRLIQPLLDDDVLVSRDQEQIESNVDTFVVVERDGAIIACCTLQPYENKFAEMGCVAVDPAYRNLGKGNAMLGYIMRKASAMGVTKLFVLTTRTAHWFLERGFVEATVHDLPPSKLAKIDLKQLWMKKNCCFKWNEFLLYEMIDRVLTL